MHGVAGAGFKYLPGLRLDAQVPQNLCHDFPPVHLDMGFFKNFPGLSTNNPYP